MGVQVADLYAKIRADSTGLDAGLADAKTKVTGLANDVKKSGDDVDSSLTNTFGNFAVLAAKGALVVAGTKKVYDATIGATMDYAKEVKDLSRLIGASSEESSKLIQVSGDVEIQYGTLSSALEAAIRTGVKPSIEGIGDLSDQYLAIQDPIDRSAFLMKTFGRSGADMAPLLELGSDGIFTLGEKAQDYGTILDDEAVGATIRFKDQLDILKNTVDGLIIRTGNFLIPILSDMIGSFKTIGNLPSSIFNNPSTLMPVSPGVVYADRGQTSYAPYSSPAISNTANPSWNFDSGSSGGHFGLASGGSGVVPSGFPNDSYPIGLTSGERYSVTPAGKSDPLLNTMKRIEGLLSKQNSQDIVTAIRDAILQVTG